MSEVVRKYELIYIHPGNLPSEDVEAMDETLNGTLERMAGELLHREDWGVRTLAYPVKKHAEGRYILLRIACPSDCLKEIERRFKITESVIKFLSVRLPDDYVQEVVPAESEEVSEEASEETSEKEVSEVVTEKVAEEENVEETREEEGVVAAVAEEVTSEIEAVNSNDDAEDKNPGEE